MSEKLKEFVEIPQEFVKDGKQFLTRCTKPSEKEFLQICKAVAIGFAVMGFIGYFVKLIHIPMCVRTALSLNYMLTIHS
ncbi:hypothetical protein WOLCODRAFT_61883 [Wolfiporia cocos MD-104 SS10]|uniref:SecE/sec61-gamma protein n=1 Tax=Wolfiporia cocos (strain MD-104) TaxID=742152 RepID=A0A2H3IW58_WOLCO|nr:hypothetical protein WOLCODRAFT_61883 [Wolfiporia cocos MD-104 SS10]